MKGRPPFRSLVATIAVIWLVALGGWWAALWHADAYGAMGATLPEATRLVLAGARLGLPFAAAALLTVLAAWRHVRGASTGWLPGVAAIAAVVVLVAVTLPMVKLCGEFVPSIAGACAR